MHDPLTVAFDIPNPFLRPRPYPPGRDGKVWGHCRLPFITVWHKDPERRGNDDSCDWFNRRGRRFRIHPRWHVWHWRFQVHPVLNFKRWAFSRCEVCGGRFRWGYSPVSRAWNGTGPLWFRSETYTRHFECDEECDRSGTAG